MAGVFARLGAAAAVVGLPLAAYACSSDHEETTARVAEHVIADGDATSVFGQSGSFTSAAANLGGRSATSLWGASGVAAEPGGLYVADSGNHRVLHFTTGSITADRVYGQGGDFTSGSANNGGVSASSLAAPSGLAYWHGAADGGSGSGLYVADTQNNRVLFFDGTSTTAARVYGQPDANSNGSTTSPTADTLFGPTGVAVAADGSLYVADKTNHRVLRYPPGVTSADRVYGQDGSFTTRSSNKGGISEDSLNGPEAVALDSSNNLWVADTANSRVLMFAPGDTTADAVYGQASFTTNLPNRGGTPAADRLNRPRGVLPVGSDVWVADTTNNRLLSFAGAGPGPASAVIGQPGFTTGSANAGGLGPKSLRTPVGIALSDAGDLFVGDSSNHRVLAYAESCQTSGCDDGNPCTDDACTMAGTCSFTPNSATPAACSGYACNPATAQCRSSCSSDTHCASPGVCRDGRCTRTCTTSNDCPGGDPCADGWCCDSSCGGSCRACDLAGSEGTCVTAAEGTDPSGECRGFGCNSAGACTVSCGTSDDCAQGFDCVTGVCTRECSGDGECNSGFCVDGACCSSQSCPAGESCNASPERRGSCWPAAGTACTTGGDCGSGFCVDGVCCDSACDQTCEACDLPGSEGTCAAIPDGADPDDECGSSAPICGGQCNGQRACRDVPAGTVCVEPGCRDGVLYERVECDGTGAACPPADGVPCPDGLVCADESTCKQKCVTGADCIGGALCSAGKCSTQVARTCTDASQCPSGFCTDGFCCNTACAGTCVSCGLQGSQGLCTPIEFGDDPDDECDGAEACGAVCDGEGACTVTPGGVPCAEQACIGPFQLALASSCPGAGEPCPERETRSCEPGRCDGKSCVTSCASDADCAATAICSDGTCMYPIPNPPSGCSTAIGRRGGPGAAWLMLALAWCIRRRRASRA